MGIGYGMLQRSTFYRPPGSYGYGGYGGTQDPIAALVGNALGTYTSQTEKAQADALAAKQEQDTASWRNFTGKLAAYKEGLTTEAPPAANVPTGFTPSGPDIGGPTGIRPPNVVTAQPTPQPLLTDPTGQAWYKSLQAPPTEYKPVAEGAGAFDPATGRTTPTGFTPPVRTKPPGYHLEKNSVTGDASWVKDSPNDPGPNAISVGLNLGSQADKPVKPTPIQGQHAEFGAGALAAWQSVERERTQNAGVEEEVGKIMASPAFVRAVPGVRSSADMVQLLKTAGASDAAQRYMRAKWSFLDNIIRTRIPGGRMSGALFNQVQNEFMPSLDPAANAQLRTNELQSILTAQGESGYDLNPDTWNAAIKRHGVGNIDLQAALAGQPSDTRLTGIRGRYK